ncbi:hypothetical protein CASFOL_003397 [Castilleja foliolosa]|uniref:Uncharacterized protein n=1 Tax=Castilleja foliolosa TaxID=1961234 RepID=A0ABD3EHQ3_9LAMI
MKSGGSWTLEKSDSAAAQLKRIDKKIAESLRDAGLLGDPGDTYSDDDDSAATDNNVNILDKIKTGRFRYRNTKAKDEAYVLFEGIENLEKDWLMHKETSEAHKLERQIEIVKKFPVGKLQDEVEELIEKIPSREFFSMIFGKARDYIYNVSYSCIRKRQEFWKGFSLPTKGNDHNSNGLKETLDSLIEEGFKISSSSALCYLSPFESENMSEAESTRQADLTTPDPDLEKKHQEVEILGQARRCVLWTPEMDFTQLCSCHDCLNKIKWLNEFQKELMAKRRLINRSGADLENKESLCMDIFLSLISTKDILRFLKNKLKAVCEKSEVPWTLERSSSIDCSIDKLNQMLKKMAKMLRGAGVFGEHGDTDSDNDDRDHSATNHDATNHDDRDNLSDKIDRLSFDCKNTQAKDEIYGFLEEIKTLEKDWVEDDHKGTAEELKLENQIKKVNEFPVEKLHAEFEELIPEVRQIEYHSKMSSKAIDCMHKTCYHCIRKGKDFWKGSPLTTKSNEHSSNGLEETLDALNKEVDLFKIRWKMSLPMYLLKMIDQTRKGD